MRKTLFLLAAVLYLSIPATAQPTSAEEVLRGHIEAVGGEDALRAVSSRYSTGEATVDTPVGPVIVAIEQYIVYPGYGLIRQNGLSSPPEIPAEMLEQTIFITPDGGWIEAAQLGGRMNLSDLSAQQAAGLESQRRMLNTTSEELSILDSDSLDITLGEPRTVKGTEVYVVEVGGDTPTSRMYAADTGLLFAAETTSAMGTATQYYSDYRTVGGIRTPFVVEIQQAGNTTLVTFSEVSFDRGLTVETITAEAEGN